MTIGPAPMIRMEEMSVRFGMVCSALRANPGASSRPAALSRARRPERLDQ
jgi:hypothetical protein